MTDGIEITVDSSAVTRGLKETRRDLNKWVKTRLTDAAERHTLPVAKSLSPRVTRPDIIVKADTRSAFLTTRARGDMRAVFALVEFGGTIRTELKPVRAKALRLADGRFVARVTRPRKIRGKGPNMKAAAQTAQAVADTVASGLARDIQRELDSGGLL